MENRLVLRLQVVVGRMAPVTRLLEVRVRRSDGLRASSKTMDSLEDRLKVQELGLLAIRIQEYIRSFLGVPGTHDLASWGRLVACWRQLETARPGEDLTLRR